MPFLAEAPSFLPDEIVKIIFSQAHVTDTANLALACRRFYRILTSQIHSELAFIIKLQTDLIAQLAKPAANETSSGDMCIEIVEEEKEANIEWAIRKLTEIKLSDEMKREMANLRIVKETVTARVGILTDLFGWSKEMAALVKDCLARNDMQTCMQSMENPAIWSKWRVLLEMMETGSEFSYLEWDQIFKEMVHEGKLALAAEAVRESGHEENKWVKYNAIRSHAIRAGREEIIARSIHLDTEKDAIVGASFASLYVVILFGLSIGLIGLFAPNGYAMPVMVSVGGFMVIVF